MDKLTTTLLTGAAMSALAVAPAMANQHKAPPQFANMKPHHTQGIGIAHINAQGKVERVSLKGHQKTVHPKGGGVTFYTTYTATTCGGLSGGCGTVYNAGGNFSTWFKQTHTIESGAWAWVSYTDNFASHYNSASGVFYVTETDDTKNAKAMKVVISKDKAAKVAGILGQTRTFHYNTSYMYSTTYGYKEHVIIHENSTVAFGEATYALKNKHATGDSFTLTDTNDHTKTTTTAGRHHTKNQYHYNGSIIVNHALTFE
jgi:hypothetical protein